MIFSSISLDNVLCEAAGEACVVRLDVHLGDLAVLYEHGEALGADRPEDRGQVQVQLQGLGELGGSVRKHTNLN